MNTEVLNTVIVGRVEPHIYAFETCSVPNFLKIGDTYRPVYQRLEEWKRRYKNLQKRYDAPAVVEDKYFRDYSVHSYVENVLGRQRIKETDFAKGLYPSNEFFRGALPEDIDKAIEDIKHSYATNNGLYSFYSINDVPAREEIQYVRNTEFTKLRDNQQQVVENFKTALSKGRKKLLMYAVMRFGKSITAMSCAEVMKDCKIVVIVSAKADVKSSWEETIKTIKNFEDFEYANGESFKEDPLIISKHKKEGKKLAICLTLQDISSDEIKDRYKELFNKTLIDLLIVDETHFGARAEHYGRVLEQDPNAKKEADEDTDEKIEKWENLQNVVHSLRSRVQLHLSGTPYRILMGNEFTKDDIICQCTYPDIIEASAKWDADHLDTEDEWENPYYGFPQMVRFAFNFNKSSLKKLELLKASGKEYAFDALFETYKRPDGAIRFVNEKEVLDLLKAINSGDEDENVLSFLNNDLIKKGKLCRHIVMVLPRRAACDAMQTLIEENPDINPLSEYVIIKAASKTSIPKNIAQVKQIITSSEKIHKKTITLTVGRLLTGTTVREWDTMIFLKGTSSPQEYDQATYRLQSPYVIRCKDEKGNIIKRNMKPQTLLVDFSPERLFFLQEQRAFYDSVNSQQYGNDKIEEEIARELSISPILCINKDKLQEVTAVDIIDKLRQYSSNRSIIDEARQIGPDYSLKDDKVLYEEIMRYAAIDSKNIMKTKAYDGEETDADIPDGGSSPDGTEKRPNKPDADKDKSDSFDKKLATFFSHILFFAYLTADEVRSLNDLICVCNSKDNKRIAKHLDLDFGILKRLSAKMNPSRRELLEFKIANVNELSHDDNLEPTEKVEQAMKQFGRWSESEIVTPANIANDIISLIPEDSVCQGFKFLDIAAKEGEFAAAILKKFGDTYKNSIYSIPTSGIAYEFTRKVYQELNMPIENIIEKYTSYDIINDSSIRIVKQLKNMKFNAVVGNPPYQEADGGAQSSAAPIYNSFVNVAIDVSQKYVNMIMPARWYSGGRGLDSFREQMLNDPHIVRLDDCIFPDTIFPGTNIRGGLCYFLRDKNYDNMTNLSRVVTHGKNSVLNDVMRSIKTEDIPTFIRDASAIAVLSKIRGTEKEFFDNEVSSLRPFGFRGYFTKDENFKSTSDGIEKPVICYGKGKQIGYIPRDLISTHTDWIDLWKVYIPRANNIGTELNDDNLNSFVGAPNTICTESYLVIGANKKYSENECKNLSGYLSTKFARFMHSLAKSSQDATSKTFRFVPIQDFSRPWTDADLYAKYNLTKDEIAYIESMIKPMD